MPDYLDRREAADYLTRRGFKITRNTLQKMATTGGGPEYRIFGIRALYVPPISTPGLRQRPRRSSAPPAKPTPTSEALQWPPRRAPHQPAVDAAHLDPSRQRNRRPAGDRTAHRGIVESGPRQNMPSPP